MKFIKFTYADGNVFSFCLDDLVTFENESEDDRDTQNILAKLP
jgi:hypothetical protein